MTAKKGLAISSRDCGRNTEIRDVQIDGQRLRVGVRRGSHDSGPPLLIFNGIGANLELLQPFVYALNEVETVIFDAPGVGGSPLPRMPYRFSSLARLADRLLTQLGYDGSVDVLGVSWGGALAQQFAYLHPERCRRLILAATCPGVIMIPGKLSVIGMLASPRRYTDPDLLHEVAGELYGGAFRHDRDLIREHGRHIRPPNGLGYLYQLFAAWGWTSVFWLHRLRQPTLVIAGSDDPIVPLVNARILASLIRRVELFIVDDGHLFLVTRPNEVAQAVRRFLATEAAANPALAGSDRTR